MIGHQAGGRDKLFYAFNLEDHVPQNLCCVVFDSLI